MRKLLIILALVSTQAFASPCDDKFPDKKEIKVPDTTVLCNTFYATVFDEAHNAAIFSTEVYQARGTGSVTRTNDFRPDKRLKNSPTPEDYTNTGYDRGHLTPAADSTTPAQMSDTFLMTNMIPQEPTVNRTPWRLLEVKVRDMPYDYVVTGAIYSFPGKTIGKRNVSVPVSYYKIIYLADGTVQAFEAENKPKSPVVETTVAEIEKKTNIKFK